MTSIRGSRFLDLAPPAPYSSFAYRDAITEEAKWNSAINVFIIYTCAFPTVTWQVFFCDGGEEKRKVLGMYTSPLTAHTHTKKTNIVCNVFTCKRSHVYNLKALLTYECHRTTQLVECGLQILCVDNATPYPANVGVISSNNRLRLICSR